jgi:hypothetical protein
LQREGIEGTERRAGSSGNSQRVQPAGRLRRIDADRAVGEVFLVGDRPGLNRRRQVREQVVQLIAGRQFVALRRRDLGRQ